MEVRIVRGSEVGPFLPDLARLRIGVFREWPYLYAGNEAYEQAYLEAYVRSPDSVFVLAMEDGCIVGASSGLPLADDAEAFRAPFETAGLDVDRVFYFGESVLLPEYRGRGLGHAFFDAREAHAAALGRFDWTAFCA
ncbi:MAG: GNAT family N-acetyltransferase, partial [Silanimonas sp.]